MNGVKSLLRQQTLWALAGVLLTIVLALAAWQPGWVNGWTDGRASTFADPMPLERPPLAAPGVLGGEENESSSLAQAATRREALSRRIELGATVLATTWSALGLLALALALTQGRRQDLVLGVSSAAWAVQTLLAARVMPGGRDGPTSAALLQLLILTGVCSLAWYVVRQVNPHKHEAPPQPVWPAWVIGVALAGIISWSRGLEDSAGSWIVSLVCLIATAVLLARMVLSGWSVVDQPRSAVLSWVALLGALAIGCGAYGLWLRVEQPQSHEVRATMWFLMRWSIVLLMAGLLLHRLAQLARANRQIGRSHRLWRGRLGSAQAELDDLRRSLSLRDSVEMQRVRRDEIARQVLSEAAACLTDSTDGDGVGATVSTLAWTRDSLDLAPHPLSDAFDTIRPCLAQRLKDTGGQLDWHIDHQVQGVVLPAGDTLQWQRLALEAVTAASCLGWVPGRLALRLEVLAGETGRHLRFSLARVVRADDDHVVAGSSGGVVLARAGEADLFGTLTVPAEQRCRTRLQRLATDLGAQLAWELDAEPASPAGDAGSTGALEVVMPLRSR